MSAHACQSIHTIYQVDMPVHQCFFPNFLLVSLAGDSFHRPVVEDAASGQESRRLHSMGSIASLHTPACIMLSRLQTLLNASDNDLGLLFAPENTHTNRNSMPFGSD